MENLRQMLNSIDLNNLLKIFDIQIAIAVLLFFVVFRTIFSRILIKIYYKFTKCKKIQKIVRCINHLMYFLFFWEFFV